MILAKKEKIPFTPPPHPMCMGPVGYDPKSLSKFLFSTPKNLPMNILHDDIAQKILSRSSLPLTPSPPLYTMKNLSRFEFSIPKNLPLDIPHHIDKKRLQSLPQPLPLPNPTPMYAPKGV